MSKRFSTISPVDDNVIFERDYANDAAVDAALNAAKQSEWRKLSLDERLRGVSELIAALMADKERLADELTKQMGRPRRYSPGELGGFEDRAKRMMDFAEGKLAAVDPGEKAGFRRRIERVPLGTVLVLSPWNYPWLTAVNAFVPALLAGNSVIIKHSEQTPLVAERISEAAKKVGLPEGTLSHLHLDYDQVGMVVQDARVNHVCFTGSVEGGRAVQKAARARFIDVGLELGGKDPAYVRSDANVDKAAEGVADGAFFNSGQSCCAVERIYVHESVYDRFVEGVVAAAKALVLDDPVLERTTLGPVVRKRNAEAILAQVNAAIQSGAKALINTEGFEGSDRGLPYLAPQVLVDVDHSMEIMREETFGPVACIQKVSSDDEAIALMNDSRFGLTASIWTKDLDEADSIGHKLDTGTVFANRCDYLDPDLPWVGVKDSGRGATLSPIGFEHLTRPKSFHLREA